MTRMKALALWLILLPLVEMVGCRAKENGDTSGLFVKDGVILFAPILNAAYFFPFKRPLHDVQLSRFIEVEYDTGFILTWYQATWREQVLNKATQIGDDIFETAAYAVAQYQEPHQLAKRNIYSFTIKHSGLEKTFVYDDRDRRFVSIKSLR